MIWHADRAALLKICDVRPTTNRYECEVRFRAHAVLGPPGRQRVRASQSLLALGAYTMFAALLTMATALGALEFDAWSWLPAAYLSGALSFYAAIRSGLNLRMVSDPSLTVPQTVFGMLACAGATA